MGENCATGVVFTRNPSDGRKEVYGEYLINAQGEDVVAGTRTPQHITKKSRVKSKEKLPSMEESMPSIFRQLKKILIKLEKHYKDMQDVEFTVENKKLWMLQTRTGKRTAKSAIKIATDMVKEKLISKKDAILRIEPKSLDTLLHPALDEKSSVEVIAKGLPASPGAATGKVVFSSDEAQRLNEMMQKVGRIVIESKDTKDWSNSWIEKVKSDQKAKGNQKAKIKNQSKIKKQKANIKKQKSKIIGPFFVVLRQLRKILRFRCYHAIDHNET